MHIVAHRGLWTQRSDQNSASALRLAVKNGWGVEFDVRDMTGRVVISHDPPRAERCVDLWQIEDVMQSGKPLFVNVKADGLAPWLQVYLGREQTFVFDMATPDIPSYLSEGGHVFTRHSDVETAPVFYEEAAGVWMDQLRRPWIEAGDVRTHLEAGKKVAIVSDELHHRDHRPLWSILKQLLDQQRGYRHALYLCTDFPGEAERFFRLDD